MKKITGILSIMTVLFFSGSLVFANTNTEKKERVVESETKEVFEDTAITAKVKEKFVEEKLFGDKDISAMSIHVETTNGVVRLTGTVDNEVQLENAVAIAKKVEGVKKVETDVKVEVKK